jgi:hypothetical protein
MLSLWKAFLALEAGPIDVLTNPKQTSDLGIKSLALSSENSESTSAYPVLSKLRKRLAYLLRTSNPIRWLLQREDDL